MSIFSSYALAILIIFFVSTTSSFSLPWSTDLWEQPSIKPMKKLEIILISRFLKIINQENLKEKNMNLSLPVRIEEMILLLEVRRFMR